MTGLGVWLSLLARRQNLMAVEPYPPRAPAMRVKALVRCFCARSSEQGAPNAPE
jgi:hypothetical protein